MNSEHAEVLREGWQVVGDGHEVAHSDFGTDVALSLSGDFATNQERAQFAQALADRLNAAPAEARPNEHVEVLRDLSEVCRAAINAGDWKVDGACDPDAALRRADAAIAALSAPKPEGEWVLVPKDAIERAIETLENDGDEHGEGRNLRAMLDAAQQPAAVDGADAKDAEIERLRSKTAMTMGVGSGDGKLFVHGDYDSIKAAQALMLRAERLAEALIAWHKQATDKGRREREESPGHSHDVLGVWDDDNGKYAGVECAQCALWFEASRLRAALDQEVGNG